MTPTSGTTAQPTSVSATPITAAASVASVAGGTGAGATPDVDITTVQAEKARQDLELKLQELIECLLELSITVYDFQAESNSLVHQKIQELIAQLSDIEGLKDKLGNMVVPWEVLSFIEDGKNPDLFSKSFIEAVAGENQFTNGKITAMKASQQKALGRCKTSFEDALTQNLGSAFPEEMMEYQEILKEVANATTASTTTATPAAGVYDTDISTAHQDGATGSTTANVNNTAPSSSSTSFSPPL
ncbi:Mediator of RNA polymerase II transcription subunit 10 [Haplosporangium sp. Z 767]|nr:Mediator of RNA polymerase II transcription subunit 10 [Haplosporangium sp. Z 767]KAF9195542.1 Mediator of RNA polymerase II transcription subunit 10 [Haplosporangium sp. Z 11]